MRILSFCIIFLFYLPSAQAADINHLNVGEGVYVEGFFSDDLVYITHIDKAKNRVRVRKADDSIAEWVHPSRLITADAARANSIERGVIVGEFVAEVLNQIGENAGSSSSACDSDDQFGCGFSQPHSFREPDPNQSSSSSATSGRFKVENNCEHPIRVALRYSDTSGNWSTNWWWEFAGNASGYLGLSNETYPTTASHEFYYYAEHQGKTFHWIGDHNYTVDGTTVGMTRVIDVSGDRDVILSCPDI